MLFFFKLLIAWIKHRLAINPKGRLQHRVSQKSHSWEGHLQISGLISAPSSFKLGCSEPSPVDLLKSARAAISQPLWTPAATPAPPRTFFLHFPCISLADSCTFPGHPWRAWQCLAIIIRKLKTAQRSSPPFYSSPTPRAAAPVQWPFAGPVCPHLPCTGEPTAGPSTADVSQWCQAEGEDDFPWAAGDPQSAIQHRVNFHFNAINLAPAGM